MSHHLKVTLEDLTSYHRDQVMDRAKRWKLSHHAEVMALVKAHRPIKHGPNVPPRGSHIFDPTKWTAPNWLWFTFGNRR